VLAKHTLLLMKASRSRRHFISAKHLAEMLPRRLYQPANLAKNDDDLRRAVSAGALYCRARQQHQQQRAASSTWRRVAVVSSKNRKALVAAKQKRCARMKSV